MMRVVTEVRTSSVHGQGLFALQAIPEGAVVWSFSRIFDRVIPQHVFVRCDKFEQKKLLRRGFRNPHGTEELVMCGDEGQFLNFPLPLGEPNVVVGGNVDGFDVLIARVNIAIGEELLVAPETDLDYPLKMITPKKEDAPPGAS